MQIPGCSGDCACSGAGILASGTCVRPSPCGGKGQRACCLFEGGACQAGLVEVPGCTGDCFCGNGTGAGQMSSGMCTVIEAIDEPEANWRAPGAPPACPLRGFADLHVHMFADLAHGGGVLAGQPAPTDSNGKFDLDGDINRALEQDYTTDLNLVKKDGTFLGGHACPTFFPTCSGKLFHGDHTLVDDGVGVGTKDAPISNLGAPLFNGWPTWRSTTHQQVYYKWLERAWRGGLRLMTMLAVTNEALCRASKRIDGTDCTDSMQPIDAQLDAAYDFQTFLDDQSGGPGQGWFRIVTTPQEARAVIAAGKLAVVLGIEVDNLFNCQFGGCDGRRKLPGEDDFAYVTRQVDEYYQKGVRHVFPIHNFDNAFGGPASWQDAINVGNRVVEGRWWDVENCFAANYGFRLDAFPQFFINLFGFGGLEAPVYPTGNQVASCNKLGLFSLGHHLLSELMTKGMIIDIDHMSNHALEATLKVVELRTPPYPVVASHVQFFDMHAQQFGGNAGRHERMRTFAQLQRIKSLGGIIAVMLKDDVQDTDNRGVKATVAYRTVSDDCRHSSKTWAQSYLYAVDTMEGPVALGSDFNGIAGHVGPRFGNDACGGDSAERSAQYRANNRLTYPFAIPDFGTFDAQVTGHRTFDFNVHGLAHVGLLPDLIADLKQIGLTDNDLDPLFRSAEAYINVWERALGGSSAGPPSQCVHPTVAADATCRAQASVADPALAATLSQSPPGPYSLGVTPVTLTVTQDSACGGPTSTCMGIVTVVDQTPPSLTCPGDFSLECTAPLTPLGVGLSSGDNCGLPFIEGCSQPAAGLPLGTTPVSCAAHDAANNRSLCGFAVTVQDTTAPDLTAPANLTGVECTAPQGASPALGTATASDRCDPSLTITNDAPAVLPLGHATVRWTAKDDAGNTSTAEQTVEVVDTTPPTIVCPAPAVGECTANHRAPFTPAAAAASDVCAGVTISNPPPGSFPLGATTLSYSVTDGVGLSASCTSSVTVADRTPPIINRLSVTPNVLWPPNHKMRAVAVQAVAADGCDAAKPSCRITAISSNEPVNGLGDGNTESDWKITGPLTAELRAERSGTLVGRIYTLQMTCADQAGNATVGTTTVTVPHDQRK